MVRKGFFGRSSSKAFSEVSQVSVDSQESKFSKKWTNSNYNFLRNNETKKVSPDREPPDKRNTPKVDKRKSKHKAKQMSENKNSLRRMKKREEVKDMLKKFPSDLKSKTSSGMYDVI